MTTSPCPIEEIPPCLNFDVNLLKERYYHGLLPREDVLYLLHKDGDFLIRITEADSMGERTEMVLSTLHDPHGHSRPSTGEPVEDDDVVHAIIQTRKNKYYVDDSNNTFNTLKIRIKRPISLASWEFRTDGFLLGETIGKAGCIEVRKGLIQKDDKEIKVSVTAVTGRSREAKVTIGELLRQCRMVRDLHHPCVVKFFGACLISQPCFFLMEYPSEGPLDMFLEKYRGTLKRDELLQMTMSAGWGLNFLHSAGIIHRDLTARNCFYDKQMVKISGFGMSRKANVYVQKVVRRMMVRWMAPETLSALRYSQKSDVYMYGILIYEIFSQSEPYEGLTNQDAKALIMSGRVNNFPGKTPKQLARFVMEKLWHPDPSKRPTMGNALQWLTQYTGIKLQIGTMQDSPAVISQYFAAPVLKDEDYKDDGKPAHASGKTPRLPPKARTPVAASPRVGTPKARTPVAASPRVGTPRARTPVAASPRVGTPRARTPVAASPRVGTPRAITPRGRNDKVIANRDKRVAEDKQQKTLPRSLMQESSVIGPGQGGAPSLPQPAVQKMPKVKKAEYENLVAFGVGIPQLQNFDETSTNRTEISHSNYDEPSQVRARTPPRSQWQNREERYGVGNIKGESHIRSLLNQEDDYFDKSAAQKEPVEKGENVEVSPNAQAKTKKLLEDRVSTNTL
uniref:Tyrosine-protein kinase n=1 Tax=Haemonchus contortus TaxID=6289 RepID=A0A7I4YGA0_HAECO